MEKLLNYINGRFEAPASGAFLDNIDPSRGVVYSQIPNSDQRDIDAAAKAARAALDSWADMDVNTRSKYLLKLADGIRTRFEEFVSAESRDNGKPVSLAATVDIPRAISNLEFYATAALHFASETHQMAGGALNFTLRKPLGVVGCISPWNLPLYLFTWKIAPALAAGNTVVAKPSEITPYTAWLLSRVAQDVDLPPGVLNIVHGAGAKAGDAISSHPDIKAVSFTGGTTTGKRIAEVAAPMFKKLSLELGGKNPNLIFADCDFDKMLKTTMRSSFSNQGQICLCGSRILMEDSIYEKFRDAFVAKTKQWKVGDPRLKETRFGAVVSQNHMEKVLGYIELAKAEGGKILCGGERIFPGGELDKGYYIAPTIIEGLDQNCRTNQEEIFGPVVTIDRFGSEAEALQKANASEYGLAATLWTSDLSRAHRLAEKIDAGIVWVNCWLLRDLRTPFGGMKNSGVGREGGFEALEFFTEPKNVCISY